MCMHPKTLNPEVCLPPPQERRKCLQVPWEPRGEPTTLHSPRCVWVCVLSVPPWWGGPSRPRACAGVAITGFSMACADLES